MLPIKKEFLKIAKLENKSLGLQMATLNKFSVLGFDNKREFDLACNFLIRIGLKFHSDSHSFIWLDGLSRVLKDLFKKQNKR